VEIQKGLVAANLYNTGQIKAFESYHTLEEQATQNGWAYNYDVILYIS
jgi:hypothetical protein